MTQYEGVDSKFRLVILAARRAKQLIAGARKRVDIKAENPMTVALEEFRQGKVNAKTMMEDQQQIETFLTQAPEPADSGTSALEALAAERLAAIGTEPLEVEATEEAEECEDVVADKEAADDNVDDNPEEIG
jgi:DNA-directed RNA polymerase omega subunit